MLCYFKGNKLYYTNIILKTKTLLQANSVSFYCSHKFSGLQLSLLLGVPTNKKTVSTNLYVVLASFSIKICREYYIRDQTTLQFYLLAPFQIVAADSSTVLCESFVTVISSSSIHKIRIKSSVL